METKRKKLGEILIEEKVIDEMQLKAALGHQQQWGGKLGTTLIEMSFVTERALADVLEKQLGLRMIDLSTLDVPESALKKLPSSVAKKHNVLPIDIRGHILTLAMSDPTDLNVIDEIQFTTGVTIRPALALESQIRKAIRRYYDAEVIDFRGGIMDIARSVDLPAEPMFIQGGTEIHAAPSGSDWPVAEFEILVQLLIDRGVITRQEWEERASRVRRRTS